LYIINKQQIIKLYSYYQNTRFNL